MVKIILLILFLGHSILFSQMVVSGKVYDKNTRTAMPYAFLIKKSTTSGAITNEDGFFKLHCLPTDTLMVSFVGYQKKEVPVTYFTNHQIIYLEQKTDLLNTITVQANMSLDLYLNILSTAKKKLKNSPEYQSKTYFTLESKYNNKPTELLECYYNADLYSQGIKHLMLKNGRIGLAEIDSNYYVSLHTTKILSGIKLLSKQDNLFPSNPLHYAKNKQKKLYDIKLLSVNDETFRLKFKPKSKYGNLFSADIWVDKLKQNIVKVEIWKDTLRHHPFIEIDPAHKLDNLNYRMVYTYNNNANQMLNKLEFHYSLDYDNRVNNRRIMTSGIFLFYEKDDAFNLPYYPNYNESFSDYDKIISQPYNELFWKHNEVLSPSKRVLKTRQFFEKNGVLLNFSGLAPLNPLFRSKIMSWDTTRLVIEDLNQEYNYRVNPKKSNDYHHFVMISDLYEFLGGIYLDQNTFGDSVYYLSKTQINIEDSYYYLKSNRYTNSLVNIVFDLIEIQRRELQELLHSDNWTTQEIDSMYTITEVKLENSIKLFLKEVQHGEVDTKMIEYIYYIKETLGVNNGLLVDNEKTDEKVTAKKNDEGISLTELYNLGSALIESGEYEKSLSILLQGEKMGDKHPWLYYNIGYCYYQLEVLDKACIYFLKAKDLGEIIDQKLVSHCDFNSKN